MCIFYTLVANKLAIGVGLAPTEIVLRTAILSLFVFHYNVDKNLIAVIFLSQTHSNHKNGSTRETCTPTLLNMSQSLHYLSYRAIMVAGVGNAQPRSLAYETSELDFCSTLHNKIRVFVFWIRITHNHPSSRNFHSTRKLKTSDLKKLSVNPTSYRLC